MSFEFLQRKQALLSELMEALNIIEKVLPSLSQDEREELWEGLNTLLEVTPVMVDAGETKGLMNIVIAPTTTPKFPPPARAVELLLQSSPTGLFASDIVSALEGKIQTSSENPRDVIYSAIAFLKKKKAITQLPDKRYVIAEKKGEDEVEPMVF